MVVLYCIDWLIWLLFVIAVILWLVGFVSCRWLDLFNGLFGAGLVLLFGWLGLAVGFCWFSW